MQKRSLNDYEFMKNYDNEEIILGRGAFGEVKLVKEINSDQKFAMKMVRFSWVLLLL